MFQVGDKVRVRSSQAVGIVHEVISQKEICVEFDHHAGSRENFKDEDLIPIPPSANLSGSYDFVSGDL